MCKIIIKVKYKQVYETEVSGTKLLRAVFLSFSTKLRAVESFKRTHCMSSSTRKNTDLLTMNEVEILAPYVR